MDEQAAQAGDGQQGLLVLLYQEKAGMRVETSAYDLPVVHQFEIPCGFGADLCARW